MTYGLTPLSLEEIEKTIQERHDKGFEYPTWEAWLPTYLAFVQVKQAQASERIADALEHFKQHGIGIEHIP